MYEFLKDILAFRLSIFIFHLIVERRCQQKLVQALSFLGHKPLNKGRSIGEEEVEGFSEGGDAILPRHRFVQCHDLTALPQVFELDNFISFYIDCSLEC